jgi:protein SCO1
MNYHRASKAVACCLATLVLAAVSAGLAACGSGGEAGAARYEFKGKVEHVDKRGSAVTIAHGEIQGYMPAMTMPFKLKDESLYDELAPGDEVTATLVVTGNRSWLEDVIRVRAVPDETFAPAGARRAEPVAGDQVPDFLLTNQDNRPIRAGKYRGKAVLLTFIYTRCPLPDYCPLMTERFAEIEKSLKADSSLYPRTHLLSITVDPDYDKPAVLRSYGLSSGLQAFDHWEFATGSREEVKRVASWFGLEYWPDKDQIVHSLRTAIIGPDGKLVKIYHGNEWKAEEVISELRSLPAREQVEIKGDPKLKVNQQTANNIHRGVGVIESIDKDTGMVQIDHEDIKDFMPAMNMPFRVKDKSLLERVAPGDRVEFALQADQSGMIIVELKKRNP